jgi:hypothetical protein
VGEPMLLSRNEFLNAFFSETDRAQRMKTPLALIAIEMDDDGSESESDALMKRWE